MSAVQAMAQRDYPAQALRLQRGAEFLNSCPARITAGFLMDVASTTGDLAAITRLLGEYERRLSPEMVRAAGANRFPPRPLHLVAGGR